MYRQRDYVESGLPMLPVTHGERITKLHILLYTVALIAVTVLPFAAQMSGYFYLVCALALGAVFMWFSWQIWTNYSDALSRRAFRYSILYLSLLFAALLIDHYAQMMFGMWA
jgi:protoheme IX farnesyltransferase